jgi:hypothetical protein
MSGFVLPRGYLGTLHRITVSVSRSITRIDCMRCALSAARHTVVLAAALLLLPVLAAAINSTSPPAPPTTPWHAAPPTFAVVATPVPMEHKATTGLIIALVVPGAMIVAIGATLYILRATRASWDIVDEHKKEPPRLRPCSEAAVSLL